MNRREFTRAVVSSAACVPFGGVAAPGDRALPKIAFVRSGSIEDAAEFLAAFREGLSDAGFFEGQNVSMEVWEGGGSRDRLHNIIKDLVRRQVSVLVTNNLATRIVKTITSTIPIVFVTGTDPLKSGFVSSINRPEANVTGVSFLGTALFAKRIELLHEVTSGAPIIGILLDTGSPQYRNQLIEADEAVRSLGQQAIVESVSTPSDISLAFSSVIQRGAQAIMVGTGSIFTDSRHQMVKFAMDHKAPTTYAVREFVDAGGLISYGASQKQAYREAATYVGRILKGEKPADLPVLQPTTFELAINLRTAKALGIEIPPLLLGRADVLIE